MPMGDFKAVKIPLIDLVRQYKGIEGEIKEVLNSVFEKGVFILGENVEKFEKEIADYCGTSYAVGVASGSDALELSLKALDIKEGDEVITTPFTFIATAEAVCANGATPVFVDIELDTYNIDPSLIEKRITKKTKAIIPVHLFGHPADLDIILPIAKKYNLKIIEDCAQAIGAAVDSKVVGGFGDVGCFSFFPSKNLSGYGDGGMVVTNNKELYDKIRMLRVHGAINKYDHQLQGRNSRLDELQAAILRIKLKYLDKWNEQRRKNAKRYDELFDSFKLGLGLIKPVEHKRVKHVYNVYSVRTKNREGLKDYLASNQISTAIYYPIPLHLQKVYKFLGYKEGDFPNSEKAARGILALPIFAQLKREEIDFISKCIYDFLIKA